MTKRDAQIYHSWVCLGGTFALRQMDSRPRPIRLVRPLLGGHMEHQRGVLDRLYFELCHSSRRFGSRYYHCISSCAARMGSKSDNPLPDMKVSDAIDYIVN